MVYTTELVFFAFLLLAVVGVFSLGYGIGVERTLRRGIRVDVTHYWDDDDPDDGETIPDVETRPQLRVVGK